MDIMDLVVILPAHIHDLVRGVDMNVTAAHASVIMSEDVRLLHVTEFNKKNSDFIKHMYIAINIFKKFPFFVFYVSIYDYVTFAG